MEQCDSIDEHRPASPGSEAKLAVTPEAHLYIDRPLPPIPPYNERRKLASHKPQRVNSLSIPHPQRLEDSHQSPPPSRASTRSWPPHRDSTTKHRSSQKVTQLTGVEVNTHNASVWDDLAVPSGSTSLWIDPAMPTSGAWVRTSGGLPVPPISSPGYDYRPRNHLSWSPGSHSRSLSPGSPDGMSSVHELYHVASYDGFSKPWGPFNRHSSDREVTDEYHGIVVDLAEPSTRPPCPPSIPKPPRHRITSFVTRSSNDISPTKPNSPTRSFTTRQSSKSHPVRPVTEPPRSGFDTDSDEDVGDSWVKSGVKKLFARRSRDESPAGRDGNTTRQPGKPGLISRTEGQVREFLAGAKYKTRVLQGDRSV